MNDNKLILYHLNIRGIISKKSSLQKMLKRVNANIVTLNETGLKMKQKPNIDNFVSFNRNR